MPITAKFLVETLRPVIESEMPEELMAYDVGAEEYAASMVLNPHSPNVDNPAQFGFLGASSAADVLEFVKLLSATFAFLTALISWSKQHRNEPELKERWAQELIKAGIPKSKAESISSRFVREIVRKQKEVSNVD